MTLSQFTEQVAAEFDRVSKIANTISGHYQIMGVFESHFGKSASHINEAAYEIARVNVIFKTQGKNPLC